MTGWVVGGLGDGVAWTKGGLSPGSSLSVVLGLAGPGSISTTIPTIPGAKYLFGFDLAPGQGANQLEEIIGSFGGFVDEPDDKVTRIAVEYPADSDKTAIYLIATGSGDLPRIDNVSVELVPEPSALVLFAAGSVGLWLVMARRRRTRASQ
jgi:hypothetical protein